MALCRSALSKKNGPLICGSLLKFNWIDGVAIRDLGSKIGLQAALLYSPYALFFEAIRLSEFYLRPSYIFRQGIMAIKNPRERYRVLRGFGTLVKHLFRKHGELAPVARQAPTVKE